MARHMTRGAFAVLVLFLAALGPPGEAPAQAPEMFATYGMPKDAVWGPVIEAFCKRQNCTHAQPVLSVL